MGFEILANTLTGPDLREALFEAQTLSYSYLLAKTYRDILLAVGDDPNPLSKPNQYYDYLKDLYNDWTDEEVTHRMTSEDDLTKAVKSTVRRNGLRRIKRMKKQSSRVMREVNRMWKNQYYGKDPIVHNALVLLHKAYRESFINVRTKLKKDAYFSVPEDRMISIDGCNTCIRDLYAYDPEKDAYVLSSTVKMSSGKLRELQLAIVPYIFNTIYSL